LFWQSSSLGTAVSRATGWSARVAVGIMLAAVTLAVGTRVIVGSGCAWTMLHAQSKTRMKG
jgi:TRAP-type C4-dicarboxylate transport system permease small subunit